jgi:hypothetical protein
MEHWPGRSSFFKRGGGRSTTWALLRDQLVNLLGLAPGHRPGLDADRPAPCQRAPAWQVIEVEVPTTVNGDLSFASGANVALGASWDVWRLKRLPLEIYGTEGMWRRTRPLGGAPLIAQPADSDWQPLDISAHPFGSPTALCAAAHRSPTTGSSAC